MKIKYTFVIIIRTKYIQMDILDSLIQIRKDKKVFQSDLLSHLGVNGTTLSKYESRKREMPFKVLKKYAEYFGYELRLLKK